MAAPSVTTAAESPAVHPDCVDSSPRVRRNDFRHADPPPGQKIRLMCSYGGQIIPRPYDKTFRYIGGDTRIIVVDRQTSLSDLYSLLSRNLLHNQPFCLKYQLPGEDLDMLISVSTDEDLENMVEEYERVNNAGGGQKRSILRLFLFPKLPPGIAQVVLQNLSAKSEDWFFDILNGKASLSAVASDRGFSEPSTVNCLLGLGDDSAGKTAVGEKEVQAYVDVAKVESSGNENGNGNCAAINHDVHWIPDSPMHGTASSIGSTSSSPSVPSLPPTGVHVVENLKDGRIEEQFQQTSVVVGGNVDLPPQKPEEIGGFTAAVTVVSGLPVVVGGEYANRIISDDERSDHGGYKKVQQTHPQIPQKQTTVFDVSSPDSISSEGTARNPWSKHAVYQEQLKQIQPGNRTISSNQPGDPNNSHIQMQTQAQEPIYLPSCQFDQNRPQVHQPQHFIPAGNHYIPAGAVPIVSYYPIYPQEQQHSPHQPYPVYIFPGNQNQPHNLPYYSELVPTTPSSYPQTPPAVMASSFSQATNIPSSKPEMVGGIYLKATPQSAQVPSSQHQLQYITLGPYPHPPQSVAANSNCDVTDPAHLQMYYEPLQSHLAAQYQTITSAPAIIIPDTPTQHTSDDIKQQIKTSRP